MRPHFDMIGPVRPPETIAVGSSIREVARLRRVYGQGRWRKRKGARHICGRSCGWAVLAV